MKKKMVALLMAVVLTGSLIGCGSGNSASDTGQTGRASETADAVEEEASEESTDASVAEGDNTLTIWGWDPSFTFVSLEEAERIYQQDHPDFKLNLIEMPWGDVQTKITTSMSAGQYDTLPDVLLLQDNAYQKNILSYPELFEDLTDSGVNFDDFGEGKLGFSTMDGKRYGIPFDNGTTVMCYRTDVLQEAGFTLDDFTDITWSTFIEQAKKVKEVTGKALLSDQSKGADQVLQMMRSAGASMFNDDGTVNLDNNEALNEAMEIYKEMLDAGVIDIKDDWNGYIESFIRGDVAGVMNGCWILASVQQAEDQAGNWGVTNIPRLEKTPNATNYSSNGGSSWGVNAFSPKKELATDFLKCTFGGNQELFDNILPATGCLTTWLPAADSEVYAEPMDFYAGDAIYQKIVDFSGKVPGNAAGVYYYEAADALATAISNVQNGADIASELQAAQQTAMFSTGN